MKAIFWIGSFFLYTASLNAQVQLELVSYPSPGAPFQTLSREVASRTSIELRSLARNFQVVDETALEQPWLWIRSLDLIRTTGGFLKPEMVLWLKRGGLLVLEPTDVSPATLSKLTEKIHSNGRAADWQPVPPDHELMRSFYLLDALPSCHGKMWQSFQFDGRVTILAIPYAFLETLQDTGQSPKCDTRIEQERSYRIFVNLLMVALATDYKKDQIHLPEILKRLR